MGPREPCQDREVAALSGLPHVLRGNRAGADGRKFVGFGSVEGGVRGIFYSCFRRSLRYTNGVESHRTITF